MSSSSKGSKKRQHASVLSDSSASGSESDDPVAKLRNDDEEGTLHSRLAFQQEMEEGKSKRPKLREPKLIGKFLDMEARTEKPKKPKKKKRKGNTSDSSSSGEEEEDDEEDEESGYVENAKDASFVKDTLVRDKERELEYKLEVKLERLVKKQKKAKGVEREMLIRAIANTQEALTKATELVKAKEEEDKAIRKSRKLKRELNLEGSEEELEDTASDEDYDEDAGSSDEFDDDDEDASALSSDSEDESTKKRKKAAVKPTPATPPPSTKKVKRTAKMQTKVLSSPSVDSKGRPMLVMEPRDPSKPLKKTKQLDIVELTKNKKANEEIHRNVSAPTYTENKKAAFREQLKKKQKEEESEESASEESSSEETEEDSEKKNSKRQTPSKSPAKGKKGKKADEDLTQVGATFVLRNVPYQVVHLGQSPLPENEKKLRPEHYTACKSLKTGDYFNFFFYPDEEDSSIIKPKLVTAKQAAAVEQSLSTKEKAMRENGAIKNKNMIMKNDEIQGVYYHPSLYQKVLIKNKKIPKPTPKSKAVASAASPKKAEGKGKDDNESSGDSSDSSASSGSESDSDGDSKTKKKPQAPAPSTPVKKPTPAKKPRAVTPAQAQKNKKESGANASPSPAPVYALPLNKMPFADDPLGKMITRFYNKQVSQVEPDEIYDLLRENYTFWKDLDNKSSSKEIMNGMEEPWRFPMEKVNEHYKDEPWKLLLVYHFWLKPQMAAKALECIQHAKSAKPASKPPVLQTEPAVKPKDKHDEESQEERQARVLQMLEERERKDKKMLQEMVAAKPKKPRQEEKEAEKEKGKEKEEQGEEEETPKAEDAGDNFANIMAVFDSSSEGEE